MRLPGARYSVKDLSLKTGRIANGVPSKIDFAAHIQSNKPKLDITAQIKTTLTFDLEKNLYQVQGLDLQANGKALDITDLVVKASGDASAQPSDARNSRMKKVRVTASGVKGKDKFEAKLDAPDLSLTKDKFSGDGIALNAKLDGALGNIVAALSLPGIEGNAQLVQSELADAGCRYETTGASLQIEAHLARHRQHRGAAIQSVRSQVGTQRHAVTNCRARASAAN